MNIILLGPQGSGKGTQARLLVEKFGFFYFESGTFLREIAQTNKHVREMLDSGSFVPDEEMASFVTAFLDEKGIVDNILFDGFPRSVRQLAVLKAWLAQRKTKIDLAFVLQIDEKETIRRLSARRADPKTEKIYNLITDPPPASLDKSSLVQREDDTPPAIKKRLGWYKEQVMPLIAELKEEIEVIELDGERPIAQIHEEIYEKILSQN